MSYTLRTDKTVSDTENHLAETFRMWGVADWSPDYNVTRAQLRRLHFTPAEAAVTLHWIDPRTGRQITLSMNTQERPQDNLRVLYLAVEALRLNEKRGISEAVGSAYLQLQAPGEPDRYGLIGITAETDQTAARKAYREAARKAHPDTGGNTEDFKQVQAAWEAICKEHGWPA